MLEDHRCWRTREVGGPERLEVMGHVEQREGRNWVEQGAGE